MDLQHLSSYIPIDRRGSLSHKVAIAHRSYGTALFADVSGFTLLTERLLSLYGKRQAPAELTTYLNQTYTALITQVHHYGGSVISFAGDAITCWFEEDDGSRGLACGLAMQKAMTNFHAIPLGATTTALQVRVGMATGYTSRFIVGDLHYLDVLAGETVNRMARAGDVAERGDVVVSREVVSDDITVAEWRGDFAVVTAAPIPPTTPLIPAMITPSAKWFIPSIYQRLQAETHFFAEIRPAAVLFCNFQGLDYDRDPEAPAKLNEFISYCQETLSLRHDGHIFQVIVGDKGNYFYAMFGVPQAHSNDSERAGRAALDIREIAKNFPYLQAMKMGVAYGRFRTGDYGGHARRTFGGLGDTVNIAARLMSEAKPDQILTTKLIFEETKHLLQFEFVGQRQVKGKQARIHVWQLLGERPPAIHSAFIDFPDPLLGRDLQLAQLTRVLGAMLFEQEQIQVIEAAKGMGKSHLAAEFIEQAIRRNIRVAIGGCQESTQHTPYAPWRQIFTTLLNLPHYGLKTRHLERIVERFNPDWVGRVPLLGDLLGISIPDTTITASLDPKARQDSLFDLAGKILRYLGQTTPMLILLEDSHWIDEVSWELLGSISRVQRDVPILYLLVQRPQRDMREFTRLAHYHHLDLRELSTSGVNDLVDYLLAGDISPLVGDLIYAHAQGVPFFTRELVVGLRETGKLYYHQEDEQWRISEEMFEALHQANCLVKVDGVWELDKTASLATLDLGIPDQVHGLVLSRLEHLPVLSQTTLKVASVIGRIFEFRVLAAAHPSHVPEYQLQADTDDLHRMDFIQRDRSYHELAYMFRHNITQQAVLETLPNDQVMVVHQDIATAVEQFYPDSVERLAYHYMQAQSVDKAMFYLEKSARKAQADYANETALHFYQQLLALEDRWQWRVEQINLLHLMGQRETEEAILHHLDEAPAYTRHFMWGRYYEVTGAYDEAWQAYQQAMAYAEQSLDETRCWVHMGNVAYAQGQYDLADEVFNHALGLLELDTDTTSLKWYTLIEAFHGLGTLYRQRGNFYGAITYAEDALGLSVELNDKQNEAIAYYQLGAIASYQRRNQEAEEYYKQALTIQKLIGDRAREGKTLTTLAQVVRDRGNYHQSQTLLNQALSILHSTNNRWEEVNVWLDLGGMFRELGVFVEAEDSLRRGMQLAQDIGDEVGVAYLLANWGLTEFDMGEYPKAEKLLQQGVVIAENADDKNLLTYFYSYLSMVYLAMGDADKAIEHANKSISLQQLLDMKWSTTDNLVVLAQAYLKRGNIAQAVDYVNQAWGLLEECGGDGPEFPERDYSACGNIFLQLGDNRFERAYALADGIIEKRAKSIQDIHLREIYVQTNAKFFKKTTGHPSDVPVN